MLEEEYGLPEDQKPDAPIIDGDGNIFTVMGVAGKALRRAGFKAKAGEMQSKVMSSGSYDEALQIIQHYVNPVPQDD